MSAAAESALLPTISDTQRRVALVQAEIGSWYWDFGSATYSLDSRWCSLLQLDPCPGRDHLERWARNIHPDDVFDFHRRLEDVRAGSSNRFECEYRILTGDSRWLWMLHRGHVLEHGADGKALRVCGVCIEIDVRKQTEVALQENEARLATALWGARAVFWQWQIGGQAIAMSPLVRDDRIYPRAVGSRPGPVVLPDSSGRSRTCRAAAARPPRERTARHRHRIPYPHRQWAVEMDTDARSRGGVGLRRQGHYRDRYLARYPRAQGSGVAQRPQPGAAAADRRDAARRTGSRFSTDSTAAYFSIVPCRTCSRKRR